MTVETAIREIYKKVLADSIKGVVNQEYWYSEWHSVYKNAKLYNIPEIQGTYSIKDFLEYITRKIQSKWG